MENKDLQNLFSTEVLRGNMRYEFRSFVENVSTYMECEGIDALNLTTQVITNADTINAIRYNEEEDNVEVNLSGKWVSVYEISYDTLLDLMDVIHTQIADMAKNKYVYEVCPHCSCEVKIEAKMVLQTCPACGKPIKPCSLCYMDKVNCYCCPFLNH